MIVVSRLFTLRLCGLIYSTRLYATFQTVLEKQDTRITTSKSGETPSFLIKHLDTVYNFEAFLSLAVIILVYWQCNTKIIWVGFWLFLDGNHIFL